MPLLELVGAMPVNVFPVRLTIMFALELFWIKRYARFTFAASNVKLVAFVTLGVVSVNGVMNWSDSGMFYFPTPNVDRYAEVGSVPSANAVAIMAHLAEPLVDRT